MSPQDRTLITDRLRLQPLDVADAASLHPIYHHPDAMRFWDTPPHATVAETRAMIDHMVHARSCWWTIRLRKEERAIGVVGYLGNPGVPGMGYILHPAAWGQGLMSEAVRAALDYGFDVLDLDRVELWIAQENRASRRLAERVGFTCRGRFRQKYHHEATSHEKMVYGLYRHEWRPSHPPHRTQIYALQPILNVPDVQATVAFYRDVLGFSIDFLYGDPPTHAAVSWAEWTAEGARIQFSQTDAATAPASQAALYLFAGPDVDTLYQHYRSRGVPIEREIDTHPWGMREFAVKDCNGTLLRFGTPA